MSSIAAFNYYANSAAAGLTNAAYNACRDICLPRTSAVLPRLQAIVRHYRMATGRTLDTDTAVRVLDRLTAERDDVPMASAFAPVADYLLRAGYTAESIHLIVGHLARHRTTAGLGLWLAPEHRDDVNGLIPPAGPQRGQWGHDEDEDE